jgi:hypothetical protein
MKYHFIEFLNKTIHFSTCIKKSSQKLHYSESSKCQVEGEDQLRSEIAIMQWAARPLSYFRGKDK